MKIHYFTPIGSDFKLEAIFDSGLYRLKLRANFAVYCKSLARKRYACVVVVRETGFVVYRNLVAKYETGSTWSCRQIPEYPDLVMLQAPESIPLGSPQSLS